MSSEFEATGSRPLLEKLSKFLKKKMKKKKKKPSLILILLLTVSFQSSC